MKRNILGRIVTVIAPSFTLVLHLGISSVYAGPWDNGNGSHPQIIAYINGIQSDPAQSPEQMAQGQQSDAAWLQTQRALLQGQTLQMEISPEQDPTTAGFVQRLYLAVLGRAADPGGFQAAVRALDSRALTRAQLRNLLAGSSEFQRSFDNRYRSILERTAEPAAVTAAIKAVVSRATLAELTKGIASSDESLRNIRRTYQDVLGRDPDGGGLNGFVRALAAGATLAELRNSVAKSAESSRNIQNEISQSLYRSPMKGEVESYQLSLASGGTLVKAREGIRQGDEAYSVNTYRDVTGSLPTDSERSKAQEVLAAGTSRQGLRRQIAYSQKSADNIQRFHQDILGHLANPNGLKTFQEALASGTAKRIEDVRGIIAHGEETQARVRVVFENELGAVATAERTQKALDALGAGQTFQKVREDIHRNFLSYPPQGTPYNRTIQFRTDSTGRIVGYSGTEKNSEVAFYYYTNPYGFHGASTYDGIRFTRYTHEATFTGRYLYNDDGTLIRIEEDAVVRTWDKSRNFVETQEKRLIYRPSGDVVITHYDVVARGGERLVRVQLTHVPSDGQKVRGVEVSVVDAVAGKVIQAHQLRDISVCLGSSGGVTLENMSRVTITQDSQQAIFSVRDQYISIESAATHPPDGANTYILNLKTGEIEASIDNPDRPYAISAPRTWNFTALNQPQTRLFLVDNGARFSSHGDTYPSRLLVYDIETGALIREVAIGDTKNLVSIEPIQSTGGIRLTYVIQGQNNQFLTKYENFDENGKLI